MKSEGMIKLMKVERTERETQCKTKGLTEKNKNKKTQEE